MLNSTQLSGNFFIITKISPNTISRLFITVQTDCKFSTATVVQWQHENHDTVDVALVQYCRFYSYSFSELWNCDEIFNSTFFFLWFHTCRNNSKSFSAQQCLAWDLNHLFDVCLLNLYCPHPSLSPRWRWWGDNNFLQLIIVRPLPASAKCSGFNYNTTKKKTLQHYLGEVEIVQIFAAVPVFTFLLYLHIS